MSLQYKSCLHPLATLLALDIYIYIYLKGCVNLKHLRNGQSMPSSTNSSTTSVDLDSSSATTFSSLHQSDLQSSVRSKTDLFGALNCTSCLTFLSLSGSDMASLPSGIEIFVGLTYLLLGDCKNIPEITELPPNIKYVEARRCISLERLPEI